MTDSPARHSPANAAALRHAATAIIVREHEGEVQVLMTRRHAALTFMGGMWVFPGGTLADSDRSAAAHALLLNPSRCHALRDLHGDALPTDICLALTFAACRETFEETGVLLALRVDGSACTKEQLERFQVERTAIAADPALFVSTLQRENLRVDISRFVYWSHWITPTGVPKRFDTRFFLVAAPASHAFIADTVETTECIWMSPARLLSAAQREEMAIAHPTRCNLIELQASLVEHGGLAGVLLANESRRVVPIMPKVVRESGGSTIVMPWDEHYATTPGDGAPEHLHYDGPLRSLPSRFQRDH